jgi:thioredoxin 1
MSISNILLGVFIVAVLVFIYYSSKKMHNMPKVANSKKIKVLDNKNFKNIIGRGVVLVDFWAPWCGPCQMIAPVLNDIAETESDKVTVAKVNVDNQQQIAGKFKVKSIPTLIMFKDGKEINRFVGYKPKRFLMKQVSLASV